jgi:hypothetical protein
LNSRIESDHPNQAVGMDSEHIGAD